MGDPSRLFDDRELSEEARSLLGAIERPQAPSVTKQAELAAKLAVGTTPAAPVALSGSAWSKVVLVGAAVVAGGVWLASELSSEPATTMPQSPLVVAPRAPPAPLSAEPPESAPAPNGALESPPPAPAPPKKPSSRDTLAEEEALLERARRAAASSPSEALSLLRQHQRRFPSGQLAAERQFLSVDVLTRLGDRAGAERQTEALIRQYPKSVYAQKLQKRRTAP